MSTYAAILVLEKSSLNSLFRNLKIAKATIM